MYYTACALTCSRLDGKQKTSGITSRRFAIACLLVATLFLIIAVATPAWAVGEGIERADTVNPEEVQYATSVGLFRRVLRRGANTFEEDLDLNSCTGSDNERFPLLEETHCSVRCGCDELC